MAWQLRIISIVGTADVEGTTVDLTREGRFLAAVEYFDDADPTTILHTHAADFSYGITAADALGRLKAEGKKVRDTRALVADAQTQYVNQEFPVD